MERLQKDVTDLTTGKVESDAALKVAEEKIKLAMKSCSKTWTLKRTLILFPKLEKITLHQRTPTYVETLPTPLPNNTRAVIVSVFCNFQNKDGHAYLNVDIHQEGKEEGGVASVLNTHFNVYANDFYYK